MACLKMCRSLKCNTAAIQVLLIKVGDRCGSVCIAVEIIHMIYRMSLFRFMLLGQPSQGSQLASIYGRLTLPLVLLLFIYMPYLRSLRPSKVCGLETSHVIIGGEELPSPGI